MMSFAVKYLPLIWAALWRRKVRTVLTVLSITVAFVLFGLLQGVDAGFAHIVELRRLDRLFTVSRFGVPLPQSYGDRIARIPDVLLVAYSIQTGGYWRDPKNGLGVVGAGEGYLEAFPEVKLTPSLRKAFASTRGGALVSRACAEAFGWRVGDRIPIVTEVPQRDGSKIWTFDVLAVFEMEGRETDRFIVTNYSYLDEGRIEHRGTANVLVERIKNPAQAGAIGKTIDGLFANSDAQTRTISERAEGLSQQNVSFNTKFFIEAVTAASLFTLLFLTGNTMMQSVMQRIPELAVLRTVGFSGFALLVLVLCEAALITLVGAVLGLFIADTLMPLAKNIVGVASIRPVVFLDGALAALLVALVSGAPPAWRARKLNIVDALVAR